jgi:hypothetical protein
MVTYGGTLLPDDATLAYVKAHNVWPKIPRCATVPVTLLTFVIFFKVT